MAEFVNGELVFSSDEYNQPVGNSHMVMGDIQPYISQIDGSVISSRSQHRTHLRDHNCIEVGNETKYLKSNNSVSPPPGLKDHIIQAVNQKLQSKRH